MLKTVSLAAIAALAFAATARADDFPLAPTDNPFTGFYVGANGGYAKGNLSDEQGSPSFDPTSLEGAIVGGQAGYNYALIDNVVVGLQGDLDWSFETGKYGPAAKIGPEFINATLTDTVTWSAAATARIGVANNGFMLYGLGGVALAQNSLTNDGQDTGGGHTAIESNVQPVQWGWTVGAGLSAMMGPLEAFAEYRYTDYGTKDYSATVGSSSVHLTDQTIRGGLNYHMR